MPSSNEITRLLSDWSEGNESALDELLPLIYGELRRLSHHYMRHERPGHMLQTTALVHEAYLRLVGHQSARWQNRTHFFSAAALVMRHVLVDYARSLRREKRGKGFSQVSLSEVAVMSADRADELVAVNTAMESLAAIDPRKGRVFELRYFGGMSVEEAAEALNVSPATVARDWKMARAWLRREIGSGVQDGA